MQKNEPYIKKYENGILVNPITENYSQPFNVRSDRRFMQRITPQKLSDIERQNKGVSKIFLPMWKNARNGFFKGKIAIREN